MARPISSRSEEPYSSNLARIDLRSSSKVARIHASILAQAASVSLPAYGTEVVTWSTCRPCITLLVKDHADRPVDDGGSSVQVRSALVLAALEEDYAALGADVVVRRLRARPLMPLVSR